MMAAKKKNEREKPAAKREKRPSLPRRALDWLLRRRLALALSVVAATFTFVAFIGFDQWYLMWIALVPVLWALDDDTLSGWEAFGISWFFGTVAYVGGYTWLAGMLEVFGHLPVPLAYLGMVLLCWAQAILFAVWGWGVNRLLKLGVPTAFTAPTLMVLVEWGVPALFPTYLSNSQYRQILYIQSADFWGPLGLSFILVLCSGVLYETLAWKVRGRRRAPVVGWVVFPVLLAGNLIYGAVTSAAIDERVASADRRIRIGMAQPNMGMQEKHLKPGEGHRRLLKQSLALEEQGAELVVWPESGFNRAIRHDVTNVKGPVMGPLETPLLFGALRWVKGQHGDPDRELYNSAYLVDGDGNVQGTFDKTYLLAFGEYIPFGDWFPILYEWSPYTAKFTPGTRTEPLQLGDLRYGVMICYEDLIPGFVRSIMEHDAHILVNMTNDSWFLRSREPLIHLGLAIFRAVEHRRFLVRSTNTGISAFVDPAGRILQQSEIFEEAAMLAEITPLDGRTVYARFGDWLIVPCFGVLLWWLRGPLRRLARCGRSRA